MRQTTNTMPKILQTSIVGLAQLYFFASLILPALIPSGFMVSRDSEGNFVELTVCSATNHRKVLMNIDTGAVVNLDADLDASTLMASIANNEPDPYSTNEMPISSNELCPFSQATADQVLTPELQFLATHQPTSRTLLQVITLRFDETKHPSLPARGPPNIS